VWARCPRILIKCTPSSRACFSGKRVYNTGSRNGVVNNITVARQHHLFFCLPASSGTQFRPTTCFPYSPYIVFVTSCSLPLWWPPGVIRAVCAVATRGYTRPFGSPERGSLLLPIFPKAIFFFIIGAPRGSTQLLGGRILGAFFSGC